MNTEMENGTQMTLEECVPMISQKQTVGASDSHVLPKELIFLQKKDISQLKMYLSEIKSLRTKEDGEKSQQQCTGTEQDSGMSMDSEYCQQEPRQSIRIMSLNQISQWNSKKWNNLMTVGIPQWFCLMQNPMDTARKCGGLSDVILLMGGELKEKTDQVEEESCSQSAMIRGQNSNSDCEKRKYMELTQKNELVESIMCAITNYTNTLKSWLESEYVEKPVISERDKAFFEYLDKQYEYLARDKTGQLYVHRVKPHKVDSFWTNAGRRFCLNDRINVDFPMVKWEDSEPWLIEDLKKLEVVDEYD